MVDQNTIWAILPDEKPSTFSAKPYEVTLAGAYGSRSMRNCSAPTASGLFRLGLKSLVCGAADHEHCRPW